MKRTDKKVGRTAKAGGSKFGNVPGRKLAPELRLVLEMAVEDALDKLFCETILPGTKIRLPLLKHQRDLILNLQTINLGLSDKQLQSLKSAKHPALAMALDNWDDFLDYVAAEANECSNERTQEWLDERAERIDEILRHHKESDQRKPQRRQTETADDASL